MNVIIQEQPEDTALDLVFVQVWINQKEQMRSWSAIYRRRSQYHFLHLVGQMPSTERVFINHFLTHPVVKKQEALTFYDKISTTLSMSPSAFPAFLTQINQSLGTIDLKIDQTMDPSDGQEYCILVKRFDVDQY